VAKLVVIKAPGNCVSMDQSESPTPGFISQIKGFLTMQRYCMATVFMNHDTPSPSAGTIGNSMIYLMLNANPKVSGEFANQ
jgi:hypothetical protein